MSGRWVVLALVLPVCGLLAACGQEAQPDPVPPVPVPPVPVPPVPVPSVPVPSVPVPSVPVPSVPVTPGPTAAGTGHELPPLTPRPPASDSVVRLPEWTSVRAKWGWRFFVIPDHEAPLISFEARLMGGALLDREGEEGTAALLAEMLRKGAGERDAEQFQEAVDFVGGTFTTAARGRYVEIRAEFLTEHKDLAYELLTDVLEKPRFDPAEFEKARSLAIDRIKAARQEPGNVMGAYWNEWLLRTRGVTARGHERSLEMVRLEDVQWAWKECSKPPRTWIAVAGDFEPDWLWKKLDIDPDRSPAMTEDGYAATYPVPRYEFSDAAPGRVLLVDKPDAIQTYFRFGGRGFDWSDPDYAARYLANTILGGRFTSRLNTALRIESGLSYGARSWFDDDLGGAFSVNSYTATETSREALELGLATYSDFVEKGLTKEELDSARAYIKGQYAPGRLETGAEAASMILSLTFDGLSRDVVDGFFPRLDALTPDEVNRVIRERFPPPKEATWVVIGRAEVLRDIVGDFGTVTETSITGPGFAPGSD